MGLTRIPVGGQLTLVAAGPGTADLLTVRGARALLEADLVVADLGTEHLLVDSATRVLTVDVEREKATERTARNRQITKSVTQGESVVRLFRGDPVLTGAFSAESAIFAEAGINYDFVPAVSMVSVQAGYAGVGLLNAETSEVRLIDAARDDIDWSSHANPNCTLVLLNAIDRVDQIVNQLVSAGHEPQTPALVATGTGSPAQRSIATTLAELPTAATAIGLAKDSMIIVSPAAERPGALSWFESRPLFGWRVLLPSTKDSVTPLYEGLARLGATIQVVPTLLVEPPRTDAAVDKAVKGLVGGRYEWVVFTCENSVTAIWNRCLEYGLDARAFSGLRIAASGPGTESSLLRFGIRADISTEGSTAELLDLFPEYDELVDPINRVLLPRADIATESLKLGLEARGWEVEDVTAYRTVRALPPAETIREAIKRGDFDAVVFTSAATVRNLIGIAGKPHARTLVACIGPKSAKTAVEHGLVVSLVAPEPTPASLLEAISVHGSQLRDAAIAAGERDWRPARRKTNARREAN